MATLCDAVDDEKCSTCRKWQESRNACFYDYNNTLSGKIIKFIFGCEKYNPW